MGGCWREHRDGLILSVRATPRARKDEIAGLWHDADHQLWLQLRVRAAPDDGAANSAIIGLLARQLDLPRSALTMESGATGRLKQIKIVGNTYKIGDRIDAMAGEEA